MPRRKSAGEIPCKYLEIRSGNTRFSNIDSTLAQGTARARAERILVLQQLRIRERTGSGALTHCEQVQLLKIKDVSAVASHAPFPRASCWRFLKIAGSPQKFAEGLPGGFFAGGTSTQRKMGWKERGREGERERGGGMGAYRVPCGNPNTVLPVEREEEEREVGQGG